MHVVPIRFTDDPAAMRRFLEALGLDAELVADGGGWVSLRASGGGVGVHSTASTDRPHEPGSTELSFEADEPLERVADRLRAAGFEPVVVDETWGRMLIVTDPDGVVVSVNETSSDHSGYSPAG